MIPVVLIISLIFTYFVSPPILALLRTSFLRQNFKGETIPSGLGLLLIINYLMLFPLLFLYPMVDPLMPLLKGFLLGVVALIGIADDFMGDHSRGFKGHVKVLLKEKRFTSGGLKAAVGLLSGVILGLYIGSNVMDLVINALIFAFSVNLFNLMDVRPGRSLKLYIVFSFLLLLWGRDQIVLLSIPILGAALRILPLDLKEQGMLGDVGSNLLGASVGFFLVFIGELPIKIFLLGVFILFQWVGDHISFSKLIERNNTLRYLDNLGRKQV